jgi:hypothetical protein
MIKSLALASTTLVALGACGVAGPGASQDELYEAMESQAASIVEYGGDGGICHVVRQAIDAGGMKYPLVYPVDVLQRYEDEHC